MRAPVAKLSRSASGRLLPIPACPLRIAALGRLALLACAFFATTAGSLAQAPPVASFRLIYSFTNGTDGGVPIAGLVLFSNTLYGTASEGGSTGSGTVFAVNADGTGFRTLHDFDELARPADPYDWFTNHEGASPSGGLVLTNGTLYGTASGGGTNGSGTIFAVGTDGTSFGVVHTFTDGVDGASPFAGLVLSGRRFYGTDVRGDIGNGGTVFAVNVDGTDFETLFDGRSPDDTLVISGNTLFGTALGGGTNEAGAVFAVDTDGTGARDLHDFGPGTGNNQLGVESNLDGFGPSGGLVLAGNTLYGTTPSGDTNGLGNVFAVNTDGTGFKKLHTFSFGVYTNAWSNLDGASPEAGLVLCGSMLYGTASAGGTNGCGTVYAVGTNGGFFTVLHTFAGFDGANPSADLLLSGNTLYGATSAGGTNGAGTVFAITLAPAPIIATNSVAEIDGQLQFTVVGVTPGATVYLQASSDPSGTAIWVPVSTNVAAGTNLTITGLTATNAPYGFFRVVETFLP